jgi:DNA-binding NarL/FixJ family response regulator
MTTRGSARRIPRRQEQLAVAGKERPIQVCIAEHNSLAEQYVLAILRQDASLDAFSLPELALNHVHREPHAFVVDRQGLHLSLSESLQVLRRRYAGAKFVLLVGECTPEETARMLRFGIHGFVPYTHIREQLAQAVRSVVQGKMWVSASVLEAHARKSIPLLEASTSQSPSNERLTQREDQIVELAKLRLSNKEIGEALNITASTVKFHLSNIFSKLGIDTRHGLCGKGGDDETWKRLMAS